VSALPVHCPDCGWTGVNTSSPTFFCVRCGCRWNSDSGEILGGVITLGIDTDLIQIARAEWDELHARVADLEAENKRLRFTIMAGIQALQLLREDMEDEEIRQK